MAFGLNRAEVIGRLGNDVSINQLASGGRVANFSLATDESFTDKQSGERVDRTEWHRVTTFQKGLIDLFAKHGKKGRLMFVSGKLRSRKWRKEGEDSDRSTTEIMLVPGSMVQFLDRLDDTAGDNGEADGPKSGGTADASAEAEGDIPM